MKYADKQLVRPQHEGGCDYGHGRRSVLVQNGKKQILHIGNAKHWGGIGCGRYPSSVEIAAYPDGRGACKQHVLYPTDEDRKILEADAKAAGKEVRVIIGKKQWEQIADQVFKHLGMAFDLNLISLKHTLLLDVEGEVDGPPEREPGPKKVHPRIESDTLFKVFHEDDVCKIVKCPILKQGGGKITYKTTRGHEIVKATKYVIEEGGGGSVEEAVDRYLSVYKQGVNEAIERLKKAADNYSYYGDRLAEAESRIEAMLKEVSK